MKDAWTLCEDEDGEPIDDDVVKIEDDEVEIVDEDRTVMVRLFERDVRIYCDTSYVGLLGIDRSLVDRG
ncbi:MAG: hypothetical protein ACOCTN_07370 [Candidatus Natronoplasma sp.]